MFQAWLSCLMDPSCALIQQFGGETFLLIQRTTGKVLRTSYTCFLGLHLLSVFSMSSFSSTSCIRLRWDSLSFVQTFCIFVTFMVWSLMTDFRRRHKRRGNCSSISTLTLVNPWTRKTMEATAPYTTGAVLTKVNHLEIFQRASWPVAQLVGQGGHLHPLPSPWLLVQGIPKIVSFDKSSNNVDSLDSRP